jgi:predicted ATPase/DNA-binding SARP family transcriptional activator
MPPIDALVNEIGSAPVFLILDNCEHLIDECAVVVERLLLGCARLSVLATSRQALGVASENAWLVPPLMGLDAVQLFVERAQSTLPSFTRTDANVETLQEICRRLDGIPLAIELAAARIRVLSPEQIAERLNDAFRLLTAGSRTALPRHRTLRGTMDWSYALLTEREQTLLRRLSVFAGTFSLEAAEDVCSGDALESEDILDGVAALVDKSLVVMEPGDGVARYRLLETVRQYGEERLDAAGERVRVHERHGKHFLMTAEAFAPKLFGGEHERGLIARIRVDHDNLRAAATWAQADLSRAEDALRFADALMWYWYGTGYWFGSGQFHDARQYALSALERAPNAPPMLRARALSASGLVALAQGLYEYSRMAFEQSLAIVGRDADPAFVGLLLCKLGASHLMVGDLETAIPLLDESELVMRPLPPQIAQSLMFFWSGWGKLLLGDLHGGRRIFEEQLELGRTTGHPTIHAHSSSMLGKTYLALGNRALAFDYLREALRRHIDIGDAWGMALDLDGLAAVATARDQYDESVRIMGAVDALRERVAIAMPGANVPERERHTAAARRHLGDAFDRVYAIGRALTMDDVTRLVNEHVGAQTAEPRVGESDVSSVGSPQRTDLTPAGASLSVSALGPLQVSIGDEIVSTAAWGSARARELLVYLLMHPEGRTKEQVGLVFWPEASSAQLRNSFHVTLYRLRKALRNPDWVMTAQDRYRVDPSVVREFDALSFERDVIAARRARKRREAGATAALERAVAQYRGDFLDGEPAGDWHLEHRDRLQKLAVDALMELGAQLTDEERYEKAADRFRQVLARDDLHEDAAYALMLCHARLGDRAAAMRLYQRFSDRMRTELDAEPSKEMTELFERVQRSGVSGA